MEQCCSLLKRPGVKALQRVCRREADRLGVWDKTRRLIELCQREECHDSTIWCHKDAMPQIVLLDIWCPGNENILEFGSSVQVIVHCCHYFLFKTVEATVWHCHFMTVTGCSVRLCHMMLWQHLSTLWYVLEQISNKKYLKKNHEKNNLQYIHMKYFTHSAVKYLSWKICVYVCS